MDDCLEAARCGGGETPISPGIDVEIPLPKVATRCFQIVVVANSIVVVRICWDFRSSPRTPVAQRIVEIAIQVGGGGGERNEITKQLRSSAKQSIADAPARTYRFLGMSGTLRVVV